MKPSDNLEHVNLTFFFTKTPPFTEDYITERRKMNELLKINYDTETPTVSARDLHEQLHIKTAFKDWFPRMCEYGFEEGKDFCSKMSETSSKGGRPSKDADITIDMAKQICMIQRSPEGKQIRQYFIDLEKAWNTPEQIMARALKMADRTIESVKAQCKFLGEQVIEQQKIITELQPKANYVDKILQSKSLVTITQIAKDYGLSGRKMNQILKELKIQYKVGGQWVLYSQYQSNGYAHSKTIDITRTDGRADVTMQTEWTQKGRLFLYEKLKKHGYVPVIEQV